MTASSSVAPEVAADGHEDDDVEEEENNEEDENNQGRRLSWTEADNIRLKLVRDQPKWTRNYCKGKKKKNDPIDLEIAGEARPMGTKTAKAKAGMPDSYLSHDDIQMYYDIQALRASTVEKTADVQLRLSREKLEAAQTREMTSIAKMYIDLLMADLSGMTDMQRAEHQRALQYFGDKVYEHSRV
ncbi:glutathione S-transferase T2-like [Panicum miliaceum]|uniref:Glutathione S-transferase T2-like n=1 Tax=Panicum miliaceum TaxID=4540 RepID=A0A3L6TKT5_PANMI|nr:glutathione S-transferase T2-like [Panicum miliaceum]